ncbi:MAG TPA: PAS domain-containing protein, partial [Myxococcales bacterium]
MTARRPNHAATPQARTGAGDARWYEKILDAIGASSPDFTYIFDRDQRFLYVSPPLLQLWGKTLDEAIGKNFADLGYPPELVQLHKEQLDRALLGTKISGSNTFVDKDGREGFYEYTFVPVFGDDGEVTSIVGTTRDVTARAESERERDETRARLEENERQFRDFAEAMPQLAFMGHGDGSVFWYNRRWYDYTGATLEQLEGWGWQSVHHPVELPRVLEAWRHSVETGASFEMVFPLRSRDGQYRRFLTRVNPVRDSTGKVVRWLGTSTDVEAADAARVEAENAERRATFLARASVALGSSLDYEQTLRQVCELLVPTAADWCTISVLDESGTLRRLAVVHRDPAKREFVEEYERAFPPSAHRAGDLLGPIREGKTVLQPVVTDADLSNAAQSEEHLRLLRGLGCSSCLMVPLIVRGEALGVISLMRGPGATAFAKPDALLAEELARRAALAIDNARLYRAAQREQDTMRFLAEASALLAGSLDYETTLKRVAQLVVPRFADWCGVDVLEDGELRSVAVAHSDPSKVEMARELRRRYPVRLDDATGLPNVLRTGRAELYENVPEEALLRAARDEEHLRILRELAVRSVVIVPLTGLNGSLGGLTVVWAESGRNYKKSDVVVLEELGRRAGIAVENSRLYAAAQNAIRLRDEFLSIASHELNTPLTSLQLQVGTLLRNLHDGTQEKVEVPRLAAKAEVIDRQVRRLGKLVESLLDVSRAAAGPVRLDLSDVDLTQVIREVAADFEGDL